MSLFSSSQRIQMNQEDSSTSSCTSRDISGCPNSTIQRKLFNELQKLKEFKKEVTNYFEKQDLKIEEIINEILKAVSLNQSNGDFDDHNFLTKKKLQIISEYSDCKTPFLTSLESEISWYRECIFYSNLNEKGTNLINKKLSFSEDILMGFKEDFLVIKIRIISQLKKFKSFLELHEDFINNNFFN